ncbi:MAG: hypothetical protein P9M15_05790 [Candidatus Electryoneaceae bacterium]|nr:hypothetical protein [Candidatus Electryoneaceae bacterium]
MLVWFDINFESFGGLYVLASDDLAQGDIVCQCYRPGGRTFLSADRYNS